jgi:hypothetical protein
MYYNKSKLGKPRFREGDLVYLLRRIIKMTRPSNKLNYKKFGPFKVKRNIKDISYCGGMGCVASRTTTVRRGWR